MAKDDRKVVTHERILNAALDEFARHGFADASVDMIARRAQVAHGTVFAHFGRKADVFAAAACLAGEHFVRTFRDIQHDGASFLEAATTWVRHLQSESPFSRLLRSLSADHRHRAVQAASDAVNSLFVNFWREWLDHCRPHISGPIGDSVSVARTIVAALSGLATMRADQPDRSVRALATLAELVERA